MSDAETMARVVLLFFRGGPWTQQDHDEWQKLTGCFVVTTKVMGDLARKILERNQDAR
jgi:hypothetical protein